MFRATFTRLSAALFACIVLLLPAASHGQGTNGTVPEPMGLRNATTLIGRHAILDGPARLAIEAAHDRYLESFARFRDGDVQKLLGIMDEMQGEGGAMPEIEVLDRFLDEWKDAVEKAGRIDDAFFGELAATFGDEGRDAVQRAKQVRARDRHLGSMSMMGGVGGVGTLDRVFWEMDPTPEEIAATDGAVRGYEAAMPRHAKKVAEARVGMIRSIAVSMVEQGFGDVSAADMEDPARMQEMMVAVQAAMQAASAELLEVQADAEDRELVAARAMRDALSPERWWRLKRAWMSAAFPMLGGGWAGNPENRLPRTARSILETLEDQEARAEVEQIRDTWFGADDRLTDELIEFGRGMAAQELGMTPFDPGASPFGELEERRAKTAAAAIQAMFARIEDEEVRAALREKIRLEPDTIVQGGMEIPIVNQAQTKTEEAIWEAAAGMSRMAQGVPTPMTLADLELMVTMLGLDDVERTTARVLYDDLIERWGAEISPMVEAAYENQRYDARGMPREDATKKLWNALREVLEATRRLDESFLSDLEATFGSDDRTDAFAAVRVQRAFDRMKAIAGSRFDSPFGVPVIVPVSPYALIGELGVDDDAAGEAMAAAIAAHEALGPAVQGWEDRRFENDRAGALEETALRLRQASIRDLPEDERMGAMLAESQRNVEIWLKRLNQRRAEADRRRGIVERVIDEHVVPVLSPLAVLELKVAMLDAGRTGAVEDGTALVVARRVLQLRDLDEGQVAVIESMLGDHLEAEIELVEAIAASVARLETPSDGMTMEQSMQRQMATEQEMEKFSFRREEMRERLLQRFLSVLTPEQIARIPALAERVGG